MKKCKNTCKKGDIYEQKNVIVSKPCKRPYKVHSKKVFLISQEPLLIKHHIWFAVVIGVLQALLLFCGVSLLILFLLVYCCPNGILIRLLSDSSDPWSHFKGGGILFEEVIKSAVRREKLLEEGRLYVRKNMLKKSWGDYYNRNKGEEVKERRRERFKVRVKKDDSVPSLEESMVEDNRRSSYNKDSPSGYITSKSKESKVEKQNRLHLKKNVLEEHLRFQLEKNLLDKRKEYYLKKKKVVENKEPAKNGENFEENPKFYLNTDQLDEKMKPDVTKNKIHEHRRMNLKKNELDEGRLSFLKKEKLNENIRTTKNQKRVLKSYFKKEKFKENTGSIVIKKRFDENIKLYLNKNNLGKNLRSFFNHSNFVKNVGKYWKNNNYYEYKISYMKKDKDDIERSFDLKKIRSGVNKYKINTNIRSELKINNRDVLNNGNIKALVNKKDLNETVMFHKVNVERPLYNKLRMSNTNKSVNVKRDILQTFMIKLVIKLQSIFKICIVQSVIIFISFSLILIGFYFRILLLLLLSVLFLIALFIISIIYINIKEEFRLALNKSLAESIKSFDIKKCKICHFGNYFAIVNENDRILLDQSRLGCCGMINYREFSINKNNPPAICCKQFTKYDWDLLDNSEVYLKKINHIKVNIGGCMPLDAKPGCLTVFEDIMSSRFSVISSVIGFGFFVSVLNLTTVTILIITLIIAINLFICLIHYK